MKRAPLPTFPKFVWDEFYWVTSAKLPSWSGYQARTGSYGSVSSKRPSHGTVHICFAPEGRDDAPLASKEIGLVKWAIENEADVHDAVIEKLFEEYPNMRDEVLDFFSKAEAKKLLPEIKSPTELKKLVGVTTIFVHPIAKRGKPFIGFELGCTWDIEQGVGILLHGAKVLEVGGAEKAMTLWIAEKYAKKS